MNVPAFGRRPRREPIASQIFLAGTADLSMHILSVPDRSISFRSLWDSLDLLLSSSLSSYHSLPLLVLSSAAEKQSGMEETRAAVSCSPPARRVVASSAAAGRFYSRQSRESGTRGDMRVRSRAFRPRRRHRILTGPTGTGREVAAVRGTLYHRCRGPLRSFRDGSLGIPAPHAKLPRARIRRP
jgi:hypothetical protein